MRQGGAPWMTNTPICCAQMVCESPDNFYHIVATHSLNIWNAQAKMNDWRTIPAKQNSLVVSRTQRQLRIAAQTDGHTLGHWTDRQRQRLDQLLTLFQVSCGHQISVNNLPTSKFPVCQIRSTDHHTNLPNTSEYAIWYALSTDTWLPDPLFTWGSSSTLDKVANSFITSSAVVLLPILSQWLFLLCFCDKCENIRQTDTQLRNVLRLKWISFL